MRLRQLEWYGVRVLPPRRHRRGGVPGESSYVFVYKYGGKLSRKFTRIFPSLHHRLARITIRVSAELECVMSSRELVVRSVMPLTVRASAKPDMSHVFVSKLYRFDLSSQR